MKTVYVKPSLQWQDIVCDKIIADSLGVSSEEYNGEARTAGRNKSAWGDLWNDDSNE